MTSNSKGSVWDRIWTWLSRLALLHQVHIVVFPSMIGIATGIATGMVGFLDGLPKSCIILVALAAMLLVVFLYGMFIDVRMRAIQADTDGGLPSIRSRIRGFCSEVPQTKADAQEPVRSLLSYVSSALSDNHATALRKAAVPILETGGGTSAWKNAFSNVKGLAFGLADSITTDDIQPFSIQAVGSETADMFRPVELTPTSPLWRATKAEFPVVPIQVPATGSGTSHGLRFPGEDTAYGMDYECRPHISKRCRVRIVYRPTEGKEYTI